jgi:hypothetical protein
VIVWYSGFNGVGVYMCASTVVCFNTCDSSCGVCKFGTRFVWLCMYIIETIDGST